MSKNKIERKFKIEGSLMTQLVPFIKKTSKKKITVSDIAGDIGISRSALNAYVKRNVTDTDKGKNYLTALKHLLKASYLNNQEDLFNLLLVKNNTLNPIFKDEFDALGLNDYNEMMSFFDSKRDYVLVFVSHFFTEVEFGIVELSEDYLSIVDHHNTRKKIFLKEVNEDLKLLIETTTGSITVSNILFEEIKSDKNDDFPNTNTPLEGVYLGKTNQSVVAGKLLMIPKENKSIKTRINAILNKEGLTPFIMTQPTTNSGKPQYDGLYLNYYYIPRSPGNPLSFDKIGVNKYLLFEGLVFGSAHRDGYLTYYVGNYDDYHDRLWLNTYYTDRDTCFKIDPKRPNKFALKSILRSVDSESRILDGHFLGYSAQNHELSGYDFFHRNKTISQLQDESWDLNSLESIKHQLSSGFQPTKISLYNKNDTPENFISQRNKLDNILDEKSYRLSDMNNDEAIFKLSDNWGLRNFLVSFFNQLNSTVKD